MTKRKNEEHVEALLTIMLTSVLYIFKAQRKEGVEQNFLHYGHILVELSVDCPKSWLVRPALPFSDHCSGIHLDILHINRL